VAMLLPDIGDLCYGCSFPCAVSNRTVQILISSCSYLCCRDFLFTDFTM
jgi:hypothetical protein